MEILSQMMSRTDSGAGIHQKAKQENNAAAKFDKMLNEAIATAVAAMKPIDKPVKPIDDNTMPVEPGKKEGIPDENLAAGVLGYQAMVVFILEGDKESATIPEILTDAADATGAVLNETYRTSEAADMSNVIKEPAETEPEPVDINASDVSTAASEAQAGEAFGKAAQTNIADKANATGAEAGDETGPINGEVMARTPETRTSEQQGNKDNDSGLSQKGDLSPLENENDKASVKGQKDKSYSDTANAVREKAAGMQEPAADTHIPLAEGIKPESYRADQQMKQTTLNAPVRTENLFDEMVSRIETMHTESKNAMTIQLKPDFLGKVALEIAMDAAGLHVRINAADGDVRSMINGQIAALIESLENKGISVVEVEVAYTGINNGAFKDSQEGHAQPENPRRSYHEADTVDGATYYAAMPYELLDYYLDEGVSSVEYRA